MPQIVVVLNDGVVKYGDKDQSGKFIWTKLLNIGSSVTQMSVQFNGSSNPQFVVGFNTGLCNKIKYINYRGLALMV